MALNEKKVGKICDIQPIQRWLSETRLALW